MSVQESFFLHVDAVGKRLWKVETWREDDGRTVLIRRYHVVISSLCKVSIYASNIWREYFLHFIVQVVTLKMNYSYSTDVEHMSKRFILIGFLQTRRSAWPVFLLLNKIVSQSLEGHPYYRNIGIYWLFHDGNNAKPYVRSLKGEVLEKVDAYVSLRHNLTVDADAKDWYFILGGAILFVSSVFLNKYMQSCSKFVYILL